LSNFLAGDNDLGPLLQATRTERMSMLAAGPIPPNAAELLTGDRLQHLIKELRSRFDYVIFDCPPVLGLADSPLIARSTEATLFVLEAGGAGVRGVQTALARVRSSGANIVGVILTKVSGKSSPYGDRYGYGYGYGAQSS
jgi:capsular exopolysaccharide synthesis family protein